MNERIEKILYLALIAFLALVIFVSISFVFNIKMVYAITAATFFTMLIYIFKNHWKGWMRPIYLLTWQSIFFVGSTLLVSLPLYLTGVENGLIFFSGGTAIYILGLILGNIIQIKEYGTGHTKIIHISDLHLGHGLGKGHLKRVWQKISALPGDIVAITGDMIEDIDFLNDEVINLLRTEKRPVLFVTGNHEAYMDRELLKSKLLAAEIVLIDGDKYKFEDITFHGIGDKGHRISKFEYPRKTEGRNVLLVHQPPQETPPFDLTLSGHVHDGQVFPFNIAFKLLLKHSSGYYPKAGLNVSPGTGSFGGSFRLAKPMEINIINF